MNANKVIHEAMGLKWVAEDKSVWNCKCDCVVPTYPTFRVNKHVFPCEHAEPNYTDPVHYCALMDWMYEENRSVRFDGFLEAKKGTSYIYFWMRHTRQEQVSIIAEAIEAGVLKCS